MKRHLYKNSFWTGLSIVIALFMTGLYGIILIHSGRVSQQLKQQLNVVVEFSKTYTDLDKSHLFDELDNHESVLAGSLNFYTAEDAKVLMSGDLSTDYFSNLEENPFHDMVTFNLKHDQYEAAKLKILKQHLLSRSYVTDVVFQEEQSAFIEQNLKKLSFLPFVIALLMTLMSIALIYNTVRLNLQSDEARIRTMKLVGAKHDFIQQPYTKSALRLGMISAGVAILLLLVFVQLMKVGLGDAASFIHYPYILVIGFVLLVIGSIIPYTATKSLLSNYLQKLRLDL
jgi:cell division transport system permease protein